MRHFIFLFISCSVCLSSFSEKTVRTVEINPDIKYQEIEGFGASDCWTVQYVGKYWNEKEKEKAAKWLFSQKKDSKGNPEGIGLSIWRVNLGAGTIEQGEESKIKDITRRAECFIDTDGNYNWNKQIGQQWFMNKAKEAGCNSFVLFSNSPPVHYTRNGLGFVTKGEEFSNLKPDKYDDFADFLCNVASYFIKKKKIPVDYISPINEPQWKWDSDYQEGSPWTNEEIKKVIMKLNTSIHKHKLNAKILITEAGTWEAMYVPEGRAFNQLHAFFESESPNYVGDIKKIDKTIAAHSYWTDAKNEDLKRIRSTVKETADQYGVKVMQTEWSLLNRLPLDGFPATYEEATYNDIALYMAKIIYADLVYAGVASWSYWTSMDVEMYGFKNRFNLIRLHTEQDQTATIEKGGFVSDTKTLWMLGNYSHFIRPGYFRIEMKGATDLSSLMGTAYVAPKGRKMVIVFTNISGYDIAVNLSSGKHKFSKYRKISSYTTDENRNLSYADISKVIKEKSQCIIRKKSTITLVFE